MMEPTGRPSPGPRALTGGRDDAPASHVKEGAKPGVTAKGKSLRCAHAEPLFYGGFHRFEKGGSRTAQLATLVNSGDAADALGIENPTCEFASLVWNFKSRSPDGSCAGNMSDHGSFVIQKRDAQK
jgi:hypothetical protein